LEDHADSTDSQAIPVVLDHRENGPFSGEASDFIYRLNQVFGYDLNPRVEAVFWERGYLSGGRESGVGQITSEGAGWFQTSEHPGTGGQNCSAQERATRDGHWGISKE
jgi:hypothetical protein